MIRPGVADEGLLDPRRGLEPLADEQLHRACRCRGSYELRLLDRAGEEKVVRATPADGDPDAVAIDVRDRLQGRGLRDHVGPLDQDVRSRERDVGGPHRIDGQEGHVPRARLRGLEHLSGRVEGHERCLDTEAAGQLAREIDGDAPKVR